MPGFTIPFALPFPACTNQGCISDNCDIFLFPHCEGHSLMHSKWAAHPHQQILLHFFWFISCFQGRAQSNQRVGQNHSRCKCTVIPTNIWCYWWYNHLQGIFDQTHAFMATVICSDTLRFKCILTQSPLAYPIMFLLIFLPSCQLQSPGWSSSRLHL